eukprot:TRINITY_DN2089_c0_g1_i1.p1 TRINITY_DN2089_c0_g1~~TRINITY_DN2089_c0_g1_i1.p1  ORF type:complete len:239 (-),score=50.09 TRINITY_DN2089_c0_g1_i1:817-1533(-)
MALDIGSKKELQAELRKYEKSLKEIENVRKKIIKAESSIFPKGTGDEVPLTQRHSNKILKLYKELEMQLVKSMRAGNEFSVKVADIQKRLDDDSIGGPPRKKRNVGLIPTGEIEVGDEVCANGEEDSWILCHVREVLPANTGFVVVDADDKVTLFRLPPSRVIALPKALPMGQVQHPKGSVVFAVFPETTTFFQGTVVNVPKRKKDKEYEILFEDDYDDLGHKQYRMIAFNLIATPPN